MARAPAARAGSFPPLSALGSEIPPRRPASQLGGRSDPSPSEPGLQGRQGEGRASALGGARGTGGGARGRALGAAPSSRDKQEGGRSAPGQSGGARCAQHVRAPGCRGQCESAATAAAGLFAQPLPLMHLRLPAPLTPSRNGFPPPPPRAGLSPLPAGARRVSQRASRASPFTPRCQLPGCQSGAPTGSRSCPRLAIALSRGWRLSIHLGRVPAPRPTRWFHPGREAAAAAS